MCALPLQACFSSPARHSLAIPFVIGRSRMRANASATKRHPICTARKLEVVSLAEPEPLAEPVAAWRPSGLGV
jgi:hypothetical protein